MLFGAAKSGRPAENASKVERFAAGRSILPCDLNVARVYGRVKQCLREKGRPIPENDLWIAATAACHELVLVTRESGVVIATARLLRPAADSALAGAEPEKHLEEAVCGDDERQGRGGGPELLHR